MLSSNFVSDFPWMPERPRVLVVACSDGRYQRSLDHFLEQRLGITFYDRLYAPGGPGALAWSGPSCFRGDQFRHEFLFLLEAHQINDVILIVHGTDAAGGPPEATCADYLRKMPGRTLAEIARQQEQDLQEVVTLLSAGEREIEVRVYRAEVGTGGSVQFRDLRKNESV